MGALRKGRAAINSTRPGGAEQLEHTSRRSQSTHHRLGNRWFTVNYRGKRRNKLCRARIRSQTSHNWVWSAGVWYGMLQEESLSDAVPRSRTWRWSRSCNGIRNWKESPILGRKHSAITKPNTCQALIVLLIWLQMNFHSGVSKSGV